MGERELLRATAERAADFLESLDERPVHERADVDELRELLGGDLADEAVDPQQVSELADVGEAGAIGIPSGRYFGFVIGGALPAALAADWLTSAWDQNAGLYVCRTGRRRGGGGRGRLAARSAGAPARRVVRFRHRLPDGARHLPRGGPLRGARGIRLGRRASRARRLAADSRRRGPRAPRHGRPRLRLLGIGTDAVVSVPVDDQGAMRPTRWVRPARPRDGPTIVCAQVGNVNTGAIDELGPIADVAEEAGRGCTSTAPSGSGRRRARGSRLLVGGAERADSWATDAHKWLNVPYDSGLAFCAHPDAHRAR